MGEKNFGEKEGRKHNSGGLKTKCLKRSRKENFRKFGRGKYFSRWETKKW